MTMTDMYCVELTDANGDTDIFPDLTADSAEEYVTGFLTGTGSWGDITACKVTRQP